MKRRFGGKLKMLTKGQAILEGPYPSQILDQKSMKCSLQASLSLQLLPRPGKLPALWCLLQLLSEAAFSKMDRVYRGPIKSI